MRHIKRILSGALVASLLMAGGLTLAPMTAVAEEEQQSDRPTRRVPTISERVFKKLAEAQEAVDAKDFNTAANVLLSMLDSTRYNTNEVGQIHNMLGFVYFSKEDYKNAIKHYKEVAKVGEGVPEGLETTTLYTLAQLSFVIERYQDALDYMEQWIAKANNPGHDPHIFMGQVYYQMKDYKNAIVQVEKGIRIAEERNITTKEQWWALLNFLYFEQENWAKVMSTLETMVKRWPKRMYWVRLAGIHGQEGNEKEQLWTMEAAWHAKMFEQQADYTNLAGLLMQDEVPYRASKVMKEGLDKKIVKRDSGNLRAYGQALQLAQEVDTAIDVFEEAAKMADDGKIYERLAQLYLDDDKYEQCVTASNNALNKGGVRKTQAVYLVRGMCQNSMDRLGDARGSFVSCRNDARGAKDDTNQRICQQWITYIDRETARREALAKANAR